MSTVTARGSAEIAEQAIFRVRLFTESGHCCSTDYLILDKDCAVCAVAEKYAAEHKWWSDRVDISYMEDVR